MVTPPPPPRSVVSSGKSWVSCPSGAAPKLGTPQAGDPSASLVSALWCVCPGLLSLCQAWYTLPFSAAACRAGPASSVAAATHGMLSAYFADEEIAVKRG